MVLGSGTSVSHRDFHSIFGLQGRHRLVFAVGTRCRFLQVASMDLPASSCVMPESEHQYHQKPYNELGRILAEMVYISKRKQL